MPAPSTSDEFIELIRKSGVLDDKRLDAYITQLRATGQFPGDTGKLATAMVRDGYLTHFQAEQFLLGRWRRFTIGKYKVLERLGSGGMGSVYLCEHKFMRRRVAVKVLPAAKAEEQASLERFYREARAVAALDHPNLVRAYDIDQEDKLHFLVMEYVDGSSLQDVIKKHGPMDVTRAAHYIRQAAIGLQHAHESGLVHRDIKPGNVLVDRTGVIKILDMGLARFFNDENDNLTKKHDENVLGTADYLAPEQALDSHGVTIQADIYSLGATFYFILTGNTPFSEGTVAQKLIWHQTRQPKSIRAIRPEVPAKLVAIVEKMMAKELSQRYLVPSEVVDALGPWTQTPIPPPPEKEMPRLCLAAMGSSPEGSGGTTQARSAVRPPSGPVALPAVPQRITSGVSQPTSSTVAQVGGMPPPSGTGSSATDFGNDSPPHPPLTPDPQSDESEPNWGAFGDEPSNPAAQVDTPVGANEPTAASRASRAASKSMRERRNRQLMMIFGAVAVALFVGAGVLFWALNPPANADKAQSGGVLYVTTQPGKTNSNSFATIGEALTRARPGDRIVVQLEKVTEQLTLSNQVGRDLTIEAAENLRPLSWQPPPTSWKAILPLLKVQQVTGLKIVGFAFDGQNRLYHDVYVLGDCPGTSFEDLQLTGTIEAPIHLVNCKGSEAKRVNLSRLRVTTGEGANPADAGIMLTATTKASEPAAITQFVTVADCRVEGPFKAGIGITGTSLDVDLRNNRIFRPAAGILSRPPTEAGRTFPYPMRLTIQSNTICDTPVALRFAELAVADTRIVVKQNLFQPTQKLAEVDNANNPKTKDLIEDGGDNVSTQSSQQGNFPLSVKKSDFTLNMDVNSKGFLLYDKESPLVRLGSPGVPPQ